MGGAAVYRVVHMQNQRRADQQIYEWRSCSLLFPRFGLLLDRDGTHNRLLMPGRYMTRRSRSLGRWIYRRYGH